MKRSYLDYAMSVIVSRALPDVRDGLKPVHRRILYSMHENGYDYSKPFRKCARIVGDVMGKYHPHGDSSIYEALVRLAQDFSMRLPLIASQGNFGSMDGDKAAAMRYTEAKLAPSSSYLLEDISKDTIDFRLNYDETTREPSVLPARFPNLLVNGSGGIAVGMATNIPPHNLGEVLTACIEMIANPEITPEELFAIVPGPDFPTGGIIMGHTGCRLASLTGRGSVILRGRTHFEEVRKDRMAIIVTEIPYQVNKASMIMKIAKLVKDKEIEGISDLRDESDRHGVRVVIELKRDAHPDVVLNLLYKNTPLQSSFGVNSLALNSGRPETMNLQAILKAFISFREEVIRRRTAFELSKARDKAHVLVGLAIAVANIDKVIEMIRTAPDPVVAKANLMAKNWEAKDVEPLIQLIDEPDRKVESGRYFLSEIQAKAILDLKLQRLTGLERDKIHADVSDLGGQIKEFLSILASREKLYGIMKDEFEQVKNDFATPRKTTIEDSEFEQDIEDLIPREDMVVTMTASGYVKRVPLSTYRAQHRGGKGRSGMSTRSEDVVSNLFVACTHTPLLFFSSKGKVYKMKAYRLPEGTPQSLGKAIINLLPVEQGEIITTILKLPENVEECEGLSVMFATASGSVRRNRLSDFINVQSNGKIAMKLDDDDNLINVRICTEEQDILLAAEGGKCVRFPVPDVRIFESRSSTGVRGMRLGADDKVIGMSILNHVDEDTEKKKAYLKEANARRRALNEADEEDTVEFDDSTMSLTEEEFQEMEANEEFILTVTDKGMGKRSSAYEYRITSRGGSGITNIDTTKRDAKVVASLPALDNEHLMMVTDGGKLIRMPISQIKKAGRNTLGVILFRLDKDEKVVSVTCVDEYDEDEDLEGQTTEVETQPVETQAIEEGQEPSLETQESSENETETETVEE
ncbi:MAG: DNA gyrase subunit A [Alphaproteobacteria bacterium]|nr:DNA gyrase subunit A [Alphaproteobacteria bacterium]